MRETAIIYAKQYGILTAILFLIIQFSGSNVVSGFSLAGLMFTAPAFLYFALTLVSISLGGRKRAAFQVAVSIAVPVVLSAYFLRDSDLITSLASSSRMLSPWFLFPLAFIGYISWKAADALDKDQPFRGFLVSAGILFVFFFLAHNGTRTEYGGPFGDEPYFGIDGVLASEAALQGNYFTQYLLYVVVSYSALFAGFRTKPG